jgi:hypothetical protein
LKVTCWDLGKDSSGGISPLPADRAFKMFFDKLAEFSLKYVLNRRLATW